jgi:hypothetical protein
MMNKQQDLEVLAQSAQEPFGWYDGMGFSTNKYDFGKAISTAIPLYTHPATSQQDLEDIYYELQFRNNLFLKRIAELEAQLGIAELEAQLAERDALLATKESE